MAHPEQPAAEGQPAQSPPVVVKKYANRRLYDTESSSYITLDTLAEMVRAGRDFVVYDARTGEDITRGVLTQIIVEEESKGRALLPTNFLRQLIGLYGDSLQGMVPRFLEHSLASFGRQQEQMRVAMKETVGKLFPFDVEEVGRQNIAMVERAMTLFTPFYPVPGQAPGAEGEAKPQTAATPAELQDEITALRAELARLQLELAARAAGPPADRRPLRPAKG